MSKTKYNIKICSDELKEIHRLTKPKKRKKKENIDDKNIYSYESVMKDRHTIIVRLIKNNKILTNREFMCLMVNSKKFRNVLKSSIREIEFEGIYFEIVPIMEKNFDEPFFYFAVKTEFKGKVDCKTYKPYFEKPGKVTTFYSPAGILLISPIPKKCKKRYHHFKSFIDHGEDKQIDSFFREIGIRTQDLFSGEIFFARKAKRLFKKTKKICLRVHGKSINFLHFRIQPTNKYYSILSEEPIESYYSLYDKLFNPVRKQKKRTYSKKQRSFA